MASFLDLAGLTHFKQKLFAELAQKNESVLVTPQTLTAAQQKQALANIGALGLSGGTITGALTVNGAMTVQAPTANANPATKQYVDQKASASVLVTAQTLDADQQKQARTNIGAISAAEVPAPDLSGYLTKSQAEATYFKASQITASQADLTAGTSPLATGSLYFVYE